LRCSINVSIAHNVGRIADGLVIEARQPERQAKLIIKSLIMNKQFNSVPSAGTKDEQRDAAQVSRSSQPIGNTLVSCGFTPEIIDELKSNEVFVFGSNWAGRHGKGAALQAVKWGAKYGVGLGLEGQTFALPTKNRNLKTCELHEINSAVIALHICVNENKDKHFLITKVGCGLSWL